MPTSRYGMKWMGCALLLLSCRIATAQTSSGTVVVFQLIDDKFIIAADSRSILRGIPSDTHCKIAAFRHKVIFASSGHSAAVQGDSKDTAPAWIVWDAAEEARAAVSMTNLTSQATAEGLVKAVADAWGSRVKNIWATEYSHHPAQVSEMAEGEDGRLTNAVFAAAVDGTVAIAGRTITLKKGAVDVYVPSLAGACRKGPCAIGQIDIVSEYLAGKTQRAASEKWGTFPGDRIKRLVALTITHEKLSPNGTAGVGGPIDMLELWKDGSIHWIYRKCNCPKSKD